MIWIRLDNVPVMGRLVVLQRRKGLASNYDCSFCNCPAVYTLLSVSPASFDLVPNTTMDCACTATYTDCNNNNTYYNETAGATWSSSSTAVATVDSTVKGRVHGVGAGTATITATFVGITSYTLNCHPLCSCTGNYGSRSGTGRCTVYKPGFVLITSPTCPTHTCPSGYNNVPGKHIIYQVLDVNGLAIQIAGMSVAEQLFNITGTCTGSPTPGTAVTDSYGTFLDDVWVCCATGSNCGKSWNQSFTVNSYVVLVTTGLSGGITGAKNAVSSSCTNGVGTCPVVTPTP